LGPQSLWDSVFPAHSATASFPGFFGGVQFFGFVLLAMNCQNAPGIHASTNFEEL